MSSKKKSNKTDQVQETSATKSLPLQPDQSSSSAKEQTVTSSKKGVPIPISDKFLVDENYMGMNKDECAKWLGNNIPISMPNWIQPK